MHHATRSSSSCIIRRISDVGSSYRTNARTPLVSALNIVSPSRCNLSLLTRCSLLRYRNMSIATRLLRLSANTAASGFRRTSATQHVRATMRAQRCFSSTSPPSPPTPSAQVNDSGTSPSDDVDSKSTSDSEHSLATGAFIIVWNYFVWGFPAYCAMMVIGSYFLPELPPLTPEEQAEVDKLIAAGANHTAESDRK